MKTSLATVPQATAQYILDRVQSLALALNNISDDGAILAKFQAGSSDPSAAWSIMIQDLNANSDGYQDLRDNLVDEWNKFAGDPALTSMGLLLVKLIDYNKQAYHENVMLKATVTLVDKMVGKVEKFVGKPKPETVVADDDDDDDDDDALPKGPTSTAAAAAAAAAAAPAAAPEEPGGKPTGVDTAKLLEDIKQKAALRREERKAIMDKWKAKETEGKLTSEQEAQKTADLEIFRSVGD